VSSAAAVVFPVHLASRAIRKDFGDWRGQLVSAIAEEQQVLSLERAETVALLLSCLVPLRGQRRIY